MLGLRSGHDRFSDLLAPPGLSASFVLRFGLIFGGHDAAAALTDGMRPLAAAAEERFDRCKHSAAFPARAIRFCLDHAGIRPRDLNEVVVADRPGRYLARMGLHLVRNLPASLRFLRRSAEGGRYLSAGARLRAALPGFRGRIRWINNHEAHAASAFAPSPFEEAAVMTVDAVGTWATAWAGIGRGGALQKLWTNDYPHSLGHFYAGLTRFIGFRPYRDEYKVMALAALGEPAYLDRFRAMIRSLPDGRFHINPACFCFQVGGPEIYSPAWIEAFGAPAAPGAAPEERERNLAASGQALLEEILNRSLRELRRVTGCRALVLAGGVALNGVWTGRLKEATGFERIFIFPAADDSGCALGACWWRALAGAEERTAVEIFDPFLGPAIPAMPAGRAGWPPVTASSAETIAAAVDLLLDEKILALARGRAEYGPRALGHRSILALPARPAMRDRLNRLKGRELFRPLAPVVTPEEAKRLAAEGADVEGAWHMTRVIAMPERARRLYPAALHDDGTARLQIAHPDLTPFLHALLVALEARTGVGALINTSLNAPDEPIVTTAEEAFACAERLNLDAVIAGDRLWRRAT